MLRVIRNKRLGTKKDLNLLLGKGRDPVKQREAKRKRLERLKSYKDREHYERQK